MKITKIKLKNFMRIREMDYSPDTHLTIIGGNNEQGKSSALMAIRILFGGKKAIVGDLLRTGARDGFAEATTDGPDPLRIRMDFKKGAVEPFQYEIYHADDDPRDAVPLKKPRTVLESLYSKLCFDVESFERKDNNGQRAVMVALDPGLDFTELDAAREKLYTKRTDVNRYLKDKNGALSGMEAFPGVPDKAVDVEALMATLTAMEEDDRRHEGLLRDFDDATTEYMRTQALVAAAEIALGDANLVQQEAVAKGATAREALDASNIPDLDPIRKQISEAGDINQRIVWNEERRVAEAQADELKDRSEELSAAIEDIDATKIERMNNSTLGIEGLGLDGDRVMYEGLPFENASDANRNRISAEIGRAQNPKLELALIRKGSEYDDDAIIRLAKWCEEKDFQVIMERVGNGPECSIIMVDGRIEDVTGEETGEDTGEETTTDEGEEN